LNYLDGKRLRQAVKAGSYCLASNREFLNAINVFPVADGDTGTNMALTLQAAVAGADAAKSNNLQDVADSIALHSLRGARGNSGVIMSQYFKGIAEFVDRKKRLSVDDIAGIFSAGASSAYSAISDPKEGTILTVITDIADHLHSAKGKINNIPHLLELAVDKGRISLNETTDKLKVLKDAGVVDAGAQGFVHFIEGIADFIKTGKIVKPPAIDIDIEQVPDIVEEHSKFRYCSEFLVKSDSFNSDEIKHRLSGDGDSLIVAITSLAGQSYLRIHIHTDEPENVKKYASSLGVLENTKIDDMKAQNRSMRKWRFNLKKTSKKTIRIVTDSTSDLPKDLADFYDIEVVPLKVIFGSKVYKDGVDLDRATFYRLLRESPDFPTTSQPSPEEFTQTYNRIFNRGDADIILSIAVSSKLSGTLNSSIKGAEEFDKGKIVHFDSYSTSLGLGYMAVKAAEMAKNGDSIKKIIKRLEAFKKNSGFYFSLKSMEYLIKGGRVGKAKGFLGKILGLKPILILDDGEVKPFAKDRNDEKITQKILSLLPDDLSDYYVAVAHAADPSKLDPVINYLKNRMGSTNILIGELGPTVGAHIGPGSWGMFFMKG